MRGKGRLSYCEKDDLNDGRPERLLLPVLAVKHLRVGRTPPPGNTRPSCEGGASSTRRYEDAIV